MSSGPLGNYGTQHTLDSAGFTSPIFPANSMWSYDSGLQMSKPSLMGAPSGIEQLETRDTKAAELAQSSLTVPEPREAAKSSINYVSLFIALGVLVAAVTINL